MRLELLEILRCPYCGGRLELVESLFHRRSPAGILDGILGCHCCVFPVVDGIPVLHLQPAATAARDRIQAGQPELARRTMIGLDDEAQAAAFESVAASETATYRETVDALGPDFEAGYFLYRFSDPTYVVADAVVRAIGTTVLQISTPGNVARAHRAGFAWQTWFADQDVDGPASWGKLIDACVDGVMTARPVAFQRFRRSHREPSSCPRP